MPKFKHGDTVLVMEGVYGGQSGEVYECLRRGCVQEFGIIVEPDTNCYQVHLDETDETVFVEETQLIPI